MFVYCNNDIIGRVVARDHYWIRYYDVNELCELMLMSFEVKKIDGGYRIL